MLRPAEMSSKKAFLRAGLPLVGLLVGGSVLLSVVRARLWLRAEGALAKK